MTTLTIDDRLDELAGRLDRLTALVEADVEARRETARRWGDLEVELWPIAGQVLDRLTFELADLEDEVTLDRLTGLARSAGRALPDVEAILRLVAPAVELGREVAPLVGPAFDTITGRLVAAEEAGLFELVGAGARVVSKITDAFGVEDIDALGENVVLILQTVRDMTQPEIMGMLQRTVHGVAEEEAVETLEAPPGLVAILREMRRPEARRGLNRLVHMLRSLGAEEETGKETGS